ncbi:MAG: PEP-CTERM-box response regulator transcription factor [Pseudomonadota bacterium]
MNAKKTLLIVEDDPGLQNQLRWCFDGFDVVTAGDRENALAQIRRHTPAVVTLDLGLPPDPGGASEGLATLKEILAIAPATKVIMVTGNDDRENAVKAVGLGAYDFYQKPVDPEILALIVGRAFYLRELEIENCRLAATQRNGSPLQGIIASSAQMLKVCQTVEKVAPTDVTVLLLGESGTGKELLARALHELSPRTAQKFVAINCAAIPEALLESELFGYEKGAFTGATKQVRGKIEYAEGGTLFLDEIGDLPMALQAKLLRFLQERVIERVGGRGEIAVDVRVICATHQDIPALVKAGRFREDLYYRISELTIHIPPLRERDGDIPLLARAFLDKFSEQHHKPPRGLSKEAMSAIEVYHWPGNIREMENRIKRAVIMSEGFQITAEDLELALTPRREEVPLNLRQVRDNAERQALERALRWFGGNVSQAAEMLGISRPTLYDLMTKYGLK